MCLNTNISSNSNKKIKCVHEFERVLDELNINEEVLVCKRCKTVEKIPIIGEPH